MADGNSRRWLVRTLCAAGLAGLSQSTAPLTLLALLALPVCCECLRALGERAWPTLLSGVVLLGVVRLLPPELMLPGVIWCAGCAALMWVELRGAYRRGGAWLTMSTGCMLLLAWLLMQRYQGPVAEGLAQDAAAWVAARRDAPSLLVQAYQAGLAAITPQLAKVPVARIGDVVIMTDEVRRELLFSLRGTIGRLLNALMPQLAACGLLVIPALTTVLPDLIRRRRTGLGDVPEADRWYMDKELGIAVALLGIGWLVRMADGGTTLGLAGGISGQVFALIYGTQGFSALLALNRMGGRSSAFGWFWLVTALLLCPEIYVIAGAADQVLDGRGLRNAPNE